MKNQLSPSDLAEFIARKQGTPTAVAEAFVRRFFEAIEDGLLDDKYVKIKGFGTFKLVSVGERESVNINTGERFLISGHTKVSFVPDANLKDLVNRPFAHFECVDLSDETDMAEFEEIDRNVAQECEEPTDETEDDTDDAEDDTNPTSEEQNTPIIPISTGEEPSASQQPATIETEESASEVLPVSQPMPVNVPSVQTDEPNGTGDSETSPQESDTPEEEEPTNDNQPTDTMEQPTTPLPARPAEETTETPTPPVTENEDTDTANESAESEDDIEVSAPHPINTAGSGNAGSGGMSYSYTEVPSPHKHNWWKTATIALCLLLLMAACYFIGYFRMLCPACFLNDAETIQQPVPQATPASKLQASPAATPPATQQPAAASADTTPAAPETAATQQQAAAPQPQTAAKPAEQPQQPKAEPKAQDSKKNETVYHKVKRGENLTRIVRRHYGTEAYVQRIIKINHLKDANNVTEGMVLTLPPLP